MAEQDEFFIPDDIDRQIERLRQSREGDRRDAEAMEFLRSYYQTDAKQEQEALNRMWNRIAGPRHFAQNTQTSEKELPMYHPDIHSQAGTLNSSRQSPPRRGGFRRRLNLLAAIVLLVVLVGSLTIVFAALRNRPGGSASPATGVPLSVTSVSMSVTPGSIAGLACGTNVTVTYTALFHVRPNSVGGTVRFTYTTNNGRGSTPASITFNPGETSKSYSFTWSGALPTDHTAPGPGGVQVTSPNQLTSQMVAPAGQCTAGAFQVTSVTMAVNPSSIQGMACGTSITVTYIATLHVAANSPGGTVQFTYTTNNGRNSTPASLTFNPGQTSRTFSFTWSGALPADHTYPGLGGIQITSPNQLTSQMVAPSGQCSTPSAAFQVTGVTMSVSPASIQGMACGTSVTVTYTATIHVTANSPGGTVQFTYTTNNGRSSTPASITFSPGQTSRTYSFTWSGALPADHTYPGLGGIQVTAPNQLTSQMVKPGGQCS